MAPCRVMVSAAIVAFSLLGVMITGCGRRDAAAPAVPPPTAAQRVQQIQGDANTPQAVKDIRLQNAAAVSGPPVRRGPAPGQ